MGINPNILSVDTLAMSTIDYTSNYNISVSSAEYTEDKDGNRQFIVKGKAALNTSSITSERRFSERYVNSTSRMVMQVMTLDGKITTVVQQDNVYNNWVRTCSKCNPRPQPKNFSSSVYGMENLPNDIMQVKLIVRADNSGASNVITITKNLVSNISEETILKRELENQVKINEIKRKSIIPIVIPEIIPAVVATSSLIPLGIIAFLLINSRKGKK